MTSPDPVGPSSVTPPGRRWWVFACVGVALAVSAVLALMARGPGAPDQRQPTRTLEVSLVDGAVIPPADRIEVPLGQPLRVVVTSDRPDEVHVHGYDISAGLAPDRASALEFIASVRGLFEVEVHSTGQLLFQLAVT